MFFPIMQAAPPGGGLGGFIIFIPMIAIFYFLLWRPQQKRMKAVQTMQTNLTRGDNVITNGGIIGKVTKVSEEDVTVEVAEGVRLKFAKSAIADVRGKPAPANDTGKKAAKTKK